VSGPRGTSVAIAQIAPAFLDLPASVDRAVRAIGDAAAAGAELVAFAESWLPGYPLWVDSGIAWDDPESKALFARLHANSVDVPGRETEALCAAARKARIEVVIGIHERDALFSRGSIYNSLLHIGADGEIRGVHRKLVPTHSERVVWAYGDGSTLHVHDTPIGRVGGLICWEHWMPLTRFAMHAKGEQIHVASWPGVKEMHQIASRSYAFEGRCFVLCAGTYLPITEVPDEVASMALIQRFAASRPDPKLLYDGNSGIIGPDGHWVVAPVSGREEIIFADIDLTRIAEEQQALDAAGHYNRPDVFRLHVNTTPHVPVTFSAGDDA
jgi:predicted amidohydrolase